MSTRPAPADFGGACLVGECELAAELLLPSTTCLGLEKTGSYLYGTWRDEHGNLLRALRGVSSDSSQMGWAFAAAPGGQLAHDDAAESRMWSGGVEIAREGDRAAFRSVGEGRGGELSFAHLPDACEWREADVLDVSGPATGPAVQWFGSWGDGACLVVTGKYRTAGTLLGRPVEGFAGHEIHYFSPGAHWMDSPYGRGREWCWQQVANEYDDGTIVQATFACGADGWGFAMVHDEDGTFHRTSDVEADATVRANGFPERITYRFLDQSWTWRIDRQGERASLGHGAMIGADGTCTRDGDDRPVRYSMGNSDWWTDGRAASIVRG
jgi:hypothetical protein